MLKLGIFLFVTSVTAQLSEDDKVDLGSQGELANEKPWYPCGYSCKVPIYTINILSLHMTK